MKWANEGLADVANVAENGHAASPQRTVCEHHWIRTILLQFRQQRHLGRWLRRLAFTRFLPPAAWGVAEKFGNLPHLFAGNAQAPSDLGKWHALLIQERLDAAAVLVKHGSLVPCGPKLFRRANPPTSASYLQCSSISSPTRPIFNSVMPLAPCSRDTTYLFSITSWDSKKNKWLCFHQHRGMFPPLILRSFVFINIVGCSFILSMHGGTMGASPGPLRGEREGAPALLGGRVRRFHQPARDG